MNNFNNSSQRIPEIYSALVISVNKSADVESIVSELKEIGIHNVEICKPKSEPIVCLDIATVKYERFWELNDALSKMFSIVDDRLQQIKNIITKHQAETYVDIAFCQYGTCPALSIYGKNMEKIRFLEANISIDPF